MTFKSKRLRAEVNDDNVLAPLSPITSPDPKPLSKRQEQNRSAQRAFRERRAQTLKEMESRLIGLDSEIKDISREFLRIRAIEVEIQKIKDAINSIFITVESMSGPSWTVPESEDAKSIIISEEQPMGAILGALRSSSTDPTLTSSN